MYEWRRKSYGVAGTVKLMATKREVTIVIPGRLYYFIVASVRVYDRGQERTSCALAISPLHYVYVHTHRNVRLRVYMYIFLSPLEIYLYTRIEILDELERQTFHGRALSIGSIKQEQQGTGVTTVQLGP